MIVAGSNISIVHKFNVFIPFTPVVNVEIN